MPSSSNFHAAVWFEETKTRLIDLHVPGTDIRSAVLGSCTPLQMVVHTAPRLARHHPIPHPTNQHNWVHPSVASPTQSNQVAATFH